MPTFVRKPRNWLRDVYDRQTGVVGMFSIEAVPDDSGAPAGFAAASPT